MGYRSTVGLAISGKMITEQKVSLDDINLIDHAFYGQPNIITKEGDLLYFHDYIKWDCGYQEVDDVQDIIARLDNDEETCDHFLFVRTGEDPSDVETMGGWWDNDFELGVDHSVHYVNPDVPQTLVITVERGCVVKVQGNLSSSTKPRVLLVDHDVLNSPNPMIVELGLEELSDVYLIALLDEHRQQALTTQGKND